MFFAMFPPRIGRVLDTSVMAGIIVFSAAFVGSTMAEQWTTPEAMEAFSNPQHLRNAFSLCLALGFLMGLLAAFACLIAWHWKRHIPQHGNSAQ